MTNHIYSSVSLVVILSIAGCLSRTVSVSPPVLNFQHMQAAGGQVTPAKPSVGGIGWNSPPIPTPAWTAPPTTTTTGWPAPTNPPTTPGWTTTAPPTTLGWTTPPPPTTAGWTTAPPPPTTVGWTTAPPSTTVGWTTAPQIGWTEPSTAVVIEMEGEAAVVGGGAAGAEHSSNTVVIGDSTNLATLDVYTGSYATLGQVAAVTEISGVDPVSGESSTLQLVEGSNSADSADFFEGHITGNYITLQNEGSSIAGGEGAIGLAGETVNESVTLVR